METGVTPEQQEPTMADKILPLLGMERYADTVIPAYAESSDPRLQGLTVAGYINNPPHSGATDVFEDLTYLKDEDPTEYETVLAATKSMIRKHLGIQN